MLKVLIVDDEPFIAQGLQVLIDWKSYGYEVAGVVYNGMEAIEFLREHTVSLILADVKMPVMDGISLLKKIREENLSDAFFVIISGYGSFEYAQQAIKYKCTDYILKPVSKQQLLELLGRLKITSHDQVEENNKHVISEKLIAELIKALEENYVLKIKSIANLVYDEFDKGKMESGMVQVNLNYLLVKLTHLVVALDDSVDQNEIIHRIKKNFLEMYSKENRECFEKFMLEYAEYLNNQRNYVSGGVLCKVEREIKQRYQENLTLKELSKKYYVNSTYLGQQFRKKYGVSFKDYLNQYRIEKAAEHLLRTDEKIYLVAEKVGYKDLDYFVNKFISIKGCTPTSYRKQLKYSK